MSEYTKGKWEASHPQDNHAAFTSTLNLGKEILMSVTWGNTIPEGEQRANAELICSLHNAAVSINPSNPSAVAEGMEGLLIICGDIKAAETDAQLYRIVHDSLIPHLAKITGGK